MRDAILPTISAFGSYRGARGRSERIHGSPRSCGARIGCETSFFFFSHSGPLPHRDSSDAMRHRRRDCGAGGSGQSVVNWRLRSRGTSARWESRACVEDTVLADCAGLSFGQGIAPPWALTACPMRCFCQHPTITPPCSLVLLTPYIRRGARTSLSRCELHSGAIIAVGRC